MDSAAQAEWQDWRDRKDAWLRSGAGFVQGQALKGFAGLAYFPFSGAWVLRAPVQRAQGFAPEVEFAASDGGAKWWAAFGTVSLSLPDATLPNASALAPTALTLYTELGAERPQSAFLPFRDATAGAETYALGRYLDVPLEWSGEEATATLDFNRAYHPACAFAEGYSCPLPPPAHHLSARIVAGERLPAHAGG